MTHGTVTSLSSWWYTGVDPKLLTHHLSRSPPEPCFLTPRDPVTPLLPVSILFGNNTALWSLPQSKFFCQLLGPGSLKDYFSLEPSPTLHHRSLAPRPCYPPALGLHT